jgi:4-hydroxybutyrate CoA-transferase
MDLGYPHNPKWCTAEEAMENIKSFDHIFVHSCAAAPQYLVKKMTESVVARDLQSVVPMHVHTEGVAPYADPKYEKNFRTLCLFIASNMRKAVNEGRADFVPIFLSEVPVLFRKNVIPVDVAMVNVSPPDAHGFCSLGISVEASLAAVQTAKYVIAQVNPLMPRTLGDGMQKTKTKTIQSNSCKTTTIHTL